MRIRVDIALIDQALLVIVEKLDRVFGGQGRHIEWPQTAVHAHAWRAVRRDVQVAAAHLDHLFQQFAKRNSRHLRTLFNSRFVSTNPETRIYKTVSRRTSSMVVIPAAIFTRPLRRKVNMPCSTAFFFNSSAEAPTRINSRSSSLISITSYKPVLPL